MAHVQLRVFVREDLLVLVPRRLIGADGLPRDIEQQETPSKNLSHRRLNGLLEAFIASAFDELQSLTFTISLLASAVEEDQQLDRPYQRGKMTVEISRLHPTRSRLFDAQHSTEADQWPTFRSVLPLIYLPHHHRRPLSLSSQSAYCMPHLALL